MGKHLDLTGQVFGRLTVIKKGSGYVKPSGAKERTWICKCECGGSNEVRTSLLKRGQTKSCGCLAAETKGFKRRPDGLCGHPLYQVWVNMNQRCYTPNNSNYQYYGAKGVYVAPEWHKDNPDGLQNFVNEMYPSYLEATKDGTKVQLDKDKLAVPGQPKCYSRSTCCWLTSTENKEYRDTLISNNDIKEIKYLAAQGDNSINRVRLICNLYKISPEELASILMTK